MIFNFLGGSKISHLRWWDVLIVTIILFGIAIYDSTIIFLNHEDPTPYLETSAIENYYAFTSQIIYLALAILYLKIRGFNFFNWKLDLNLKDTLYGIFLFIILALCMDIMFIFIDKSESFFPNLNHPSASNIVNNFLLNPTVSSIIYAILNGIYEEIYFLGMCLWVDTKFRKISFAFSLVIRFAFHTYQGIPTALGIALFLGIIYYILYTKSKSKNLYPFFLSHAIADVIGLSVIYYLPFNF